MDIDGYITRNGDGDTGVIGLKNLEATPPVHTFYDYRDQLKNYIYGTYLEKTDRSERVT